MSDNRDAIAQCFAPQCGKMIRKGDPVLRKDGATACCAECAREIDRLS